MELPSMVQRSGDTLIVRSVVSGNQIYLEHNAGGNSARNNAGDSSPLHRNNTNNSSNNNVSNTSALEQQLERYRIAAQQQQQQQQQQHYQQQMQLQQQQHQQQQQQQQKQQHATSGQQLPSAELKDEGLPQCKIKRNYSCSYCTYFTQNPRYHLTHLRDVHGEKIVINKCKLCLYASRHFQKLVRHMKMVHGCTEGIPGQHGQPRKRGVNREARKRKLEQSAIDACSGSPSTLGGGITSGQLVDMRPAEQAKRDLHLQDQQLRREVLAFNKQHQEEKQRQHQQQQQQQQLQQNAAEAIFVAAYERQLQAQRERELEAAQQQQRQHQQQPEARCDDVTSPAVSPQNFHQASSQNQQISNKSLDVVTPTESNPPPDTSLSANAAAAYPADQEPSQNRLLKCSICDFTTLYRAQLVDHELEEHCKTKFFRCEKCSYVTHIKARFSKHVKYHSMPMIKCVTCDFRTPYKWNLDRHMKNHGGAGPFKCAACDFTADIKQSLTVHEMNHHVPPVGHAAGMSLARRRNKVGGTDLSDDFLSDCAELLEDQFNNNNIDDYEEALADVDVYGKRSKYEDEEPTDLSQKGGSSDTSSIHNQSMNGGGAVTPKSKRPIPNLIPIQKINNSVLNLSKDLVASRSSLTDIASMFFTEKQLSEILQPLDKNDAAQLSPTTTIASTSSQNTRSLLQRKLQSGSGASGEGGKGGGGGGSLFDKLKLSALTPGGPSENLICPCGHMAKCLSESIIHRKSCNFTAITTDDDNDEEEEQDDIDGRLEIDFDDDDKQSHSALNLSVSGSTRCQHCRHRCKSSTDLINHLKQCSEASRCMNDSYDSFSGGESNSIGRVEICNEQQEQQQQQRQQRQQHHPMENRVFVWNKIPSGSVGTTDDNPSDSCQREGSISDIIVSGPNGHNDENSYYGVETAPGYGEVTKKMTPEEEAANSSLKKVYKCPHCSFWASTASRFHVHIVGHLNKKPFECSLCSYRSNWRWDITKHIRLKTIRDPSHKNARVLMNDETGRRNYTKYNKYITLMKVTEEDGDPKLMKSGEMTPNQVASLAFLNDYKKSTSSSSNGGVNALNGIKDDVTLEPITTPTTTSPTKIGTQAAIGCSETTESQLPENFMHLPFIANAMMSAANLVNQQQEQEQQQVTLITPSVTISAIKRSPPPPTPTTNTGKPSDDLIMDVKQEGNERKSFYKCRKCTFRHGNRDAVLAHVKNHYQEHAIAAATTTSTSATKTALEQAAVNSNLYMNKVFAAMCLSQQQQQQNQKSDPTSDGSSTIPEVGQQRQQQHSILSAGLLQQAIQGAVSTSGPGSSSNSSATALSGLALALAGKNTNKISANGVNATSILEHGEQNASQNEASSSLSALSTGASQTHATKTSCLPQMHTRLPQHHHHHHHTHQQQQQHSLQHLLTTTHDSAGRNVLQSPRGVGINNNIKNNNNTNNNNNNDNNNNSNNNNNNNHHHLHNTNNNYNNININKNNSVLGLTTSTSSTQMPATETIILSPNSSLSLSNTSLSPNSSKSTATNPTSNATTTTAKTVPATAISTASATSAASTVTTFPTASSCCSSSNSNRKIINSNSQKVSFGGDASSSLFTSAGDGGSSNNSNNNNNSGSLQCVGVDVGVNGVSGGICGIGGVHGFYNNNHSSTTTPISSCNLLLNTATANTTTTTTTSTSTSTNITSNNLLTNDNERRDPSPYRCGHCHQVSNWKHVIQRHCRLKHAGDIRIETLDRSNTGTAAERHIAPIYRPLGNGASNESTSFGLTLKALQQQNVNNQNSSNQQSNNLSAPNNNNNLNNSSNNGNNNNNNTNNNNNNNHVLINKNAVEQLMLSPLTSNKTNTPLPQDIHAVAAAAYLAAAYKAATANASSSTNAVERIIPDDLLLQQQLQQNEQIEITRLPSNNSTHSSQNNVAASSLAQLLEQSSPASSSLQPQQNTKSKQQKCPLCPYISESKSQMNYHISLHKPTQYECALCTFVCAKKQHLSSHMRSVHQQHVAAGANIGLAGTAAGGVVPNGAISNLDFSVALQLAAAAQAQQDSTALLQASSVVDLSALKALTAVDCGALLQKQAQHLQQTQQQQQQQQQQQLSSDMFQHFKIVSYCGKCPARFPQKLHDSINSSEFHDHLKAHHPSENAVYKCEFCDFRAPHDTILQAHRFVHTSKYQEKCNELIRNCKEDPNHPPPKLIQLTVNKYGGVTQTLQTPTMTVWVVDNDFTEQLKEQQQQQQTQAHQQQQPQNCSISSSSTNSPFDNTNSLLKKQLESGPAPLPSCSALARNSLSPKADEYSSAVPSTSASVATSDLAADAGSESGSLSISPAPLEKCQHCPFETTNTQLYKTHLLHHICITQIKEAYCCEHCDYTDQEETNIEEHTRLHFNAMEKLKSVAFFTSYDKLELSTERIVEIDDTERIVRNGERQDSQSNSNNNNGNNNCKENSDNNTKHTNSNSNHNNNNNNKQHAIKKEHNNNNEDNVINENTLHEKREKDAGSVSTLMQRDEAMDTTNNRNELIHTNLPPPPNPTSTETNVHRKPISTKIILYKSDGLLSIKKDFDGNNNGGGGSVVCSGHNERDNISDRLRRRISRNSTSHTSSGSDESQHQQSHKTILVNAKTGQVISRN